MSQTVIGLYSFCFRVLTVLTRRFRRSRLKYFVRLAITIPISYYLQNDNMRTKHKINTFTCTIYNSILFEENTLSSTCRDHAESELVQNNVPSYYDYGFLNYDYLSCEICVINYKNYENQSLWIIHLWHENWNIAREMKVDSIDVIRHAQPSISRVSLDRRMPTSQYKYYTLLYYYKYFKCVTRAKGAVCTVCPRNEK